MARIKVAYIGGGSTRAPGTMASFVVHGESLKGSEIVLIDLHAERLDLVRRISEGLAAAAGVELTVTATTDRAAGLEDCDAVLSSFRPGGFEARVLDERIPLRHDIIGQETQGPGGFFMALRSITAMQEILADMEARCPGARIFNYTNPVNIVAQAVADNSDMPIVSLCEGPLFGPRLLAEAVGLDPERLDVISIGLNHGSWSIRHRYGDEDFIEVLRTVSRERRDDPDLSLERRRALQLALAMGAVPSSYFQYYYFERERLAELQAKPTTRAEDILAQVPSYWEHYLEQAGQSKPHLDPGRSRGGLHELELAVDAIDAVYNDRGTVLPVNVPNQGSLAGFEDDLVVETIGRCDKDFVTPLPQEVRLPRHLRGLVKSLAEYQRASADAAWSGGRTDAIRALASHPLVRSINTAERLYDEMATALQEHLPQRLLPQQLVS